MAEPIKCAIYARYSTHNQRDASIDDQVRKCVDAAASKGWEVLPDHIFADKALSGKSISPRTEFKKLLSAATSGSCPFNKILVDETSRVSRNTKEALDVFSLLTFYGVHVYYVAQGIDTSHESAEQMITVNGMIDSLYLRNLAKETHRGIEGQVLKGYSGGGKRYGYRSVPVHSGKVDIYGQPEADGYRLVIVPEEAETVIRIFQYFAEKGFSGRKIVRIFNKETKETGSPKPPRGKWWAISTILGSRKFRRGILNNEIYIGRYYWNCARSLINPSSGKRTVRMNDKSAWQLVHHPQLAIVPENLWLKAKNRQKIIIAVTRGRYTKGKALYSQNLLTGLLKCPDCGGNLVIVSGGNYGKYGCSNNWNKGLSVCPNDSRYPKIDLEIKAVEAIVPDFFGAHFIEYLFKEVNSLLATKIKEAKPSWEEDAVATELAKNEKEIANLLNAIKAGIISPSVRDNFIVLEKKKAILTKRLRIAQIPDNPKGLKISRKALLAFLKDMRQTLRLNVAAARDVLRKLALLA